LKKYAVFSFVAALMGSAAVVSTTAIETQGATASLPQCNTASLGAAVQKIVPHVLPGSITPGLPSGTPFVSLISSAPAQPANPPSEPTPIGPTPAYCQVAFVYYPGAVGPSATVPPSPTSPGVPYPAYNVGEAQAIQIQISLPLGAADGGSGGVRGNWNGDNMVGASPGLSGTIGWANYAEGLDHDTGPVYAIRLGYVASETDTGQYYAGLANQGVADSSNFPIINSGPLANKIAYGTVADFAYRGTHYGKEWADAIATVYYGKVPHRHYYDGCSGAGMEGMGQLQNYGDEYDGLLIGAPAYRFQQFRLADSWPYLVMRKLVQLDGTGALLTVAQETNLNTAVLAACDVEGTDTVADGIIADPRLCTLNFTAQSQVCGVAGAPTAPLCLTTDQAQAMDRVWDGPRNSHNARMWYPYDIGIPLGGAGLTGYSVAGTASVGVTGSTTQVVQWDHANANWDVQDCLFVDQESLELGTTNILGLGGSTGPFGSTPAIAACGSNGPGSPITYEDEMTRGAKTIDPYSDNQNPVLTAALNHGTKVIQLHGTADAAIRWRQDVDYYNRVAVWFAGGTREADYKRLHSWYRFFPMPSVGHCTGGLGGGNGPSAYDPFIVLRNWVENNVEPKSILALAAGNAVDPGRTRPLCPFPQTAIYDGEGSINDVNSFHCGGNLEILPVACNDVIAKFQQENTGNLDFAGVGLTERECFQYLPPPHAGTTSSP